MSALTGRAVRRLRPTASYRLGLRGLLRLTIDPVRQRQLRAEIREVTDTGEIPRGSR